MARVLLLLLLPLLPLVYADIIDWINVDYACNPPKSASSATKDAQNAILSAARSTAARGPWCPSLAHGFDPTLAYSSQLIILAGLLTIGRNVTGVRRPRLRIGAWTSFLPVDLLFYAAATTSPTISIKPHSRILQPRHRNLKKPPPKAKRRPAHPRRRSRYPQVRLGQLVRTRFKTERRLCFPCFFFVLNAAQVNPDVRTLSGPPSINAVSQCVVLNALAYALSGCSTCSQDAARFIDAYFVSSATKMNPNVNYGQIVRGPGPDGQQGAFTGILDIRGLVKVINAICILKNASSPDWTAARDAAMTKWLKIYFNWLQTSSMGRAVAGKANNHVTFYYVQLVAVQIALGDSEGAAKTLNTYFDNKFPEQIAKSGEQPFEAVRTRPFHYRCFHLEAMMTLAKLGDWLGLDFWTRKSKYGSSIKDAVDFTMRVPPKGEDVTELVPHVAAAMAAYGDPKGTYASFIHKVNPSYQKDPAWFYNQPEAFTQAPNAATRKAGKRGEPDDVGDNPTDGNATAGDAVGGGGGADDDATGGDQSKPPQWTCAPPDLIKVGIYANKYGWELEYLLYVVCEALAPFYLL
ncbi:hypothetical protein MKEN_00810300 [Mycena kentingensis (nom. inval.)]|nr:hypothetical protein MKEN_00810300 [Mycena kentingensis (nom. inval.)]